MRHTENEIAEAVAKFLATVPNHRASIRSIKDNVPKFIQLTDDDQQISTTRSGEQLWEQQVRNIVSHRKDVIGNWVFEGRLAYDPNFLSLTEKGLAAISKQKTQA